jgi:hypothetical protein
MMLPEVEEFFVKVRGSKCWSIIGGAGTGSVISLRFGDKVRMKQALRNPHLSMEERIFDGERSLIVYCDWRLFQLAKRATGGDCTVGPWESRQLFPYQAVGAEFLRSRDYALLADEMGLGKTAQALMAAEMRLARASGSGPAVLILCPAIAKRHWAREVKRWTPGGHEAQILDGVRPDAIPISRYVIANYDILYGQRRRTAAGKLEAREGLDGWEKTLASLRFPIVICDEAHNLRGEKSRRTKAVAAVAKESTCVWLLTGTPMPNHVRDIWALWDLASAGLAGWFWPWAKCYAGAVKGQYGWAADGASRQEELGKRLSFWCLGRTKASVGLQLPS